MLPQPAFVYRARTKPAQGLALVLLVLALAVGLAGCGGSASSNATSSNQAPSGGATAAQVASAAGNIRISGWQPYQNEKVQNAGSVKAKWSYLSSEPQVLTTAKSGEFDLVTSSGTQMHALEALGTVHPIPVSLLSNYDSITPVLRDAPIWSSEKQIVGVPFAVLPVFTAWNSADVPEPKSLLELVKPVYRNAIGMLDDPENIAKIAKAQGVQNTSEMTHAQFAKAMAFLEELKPNIKTIMQEGEEGQLLTRGDIKLTLGGFGAELGKAVAANPKIKFSLTDQVTFIEAWSLLSTKHEPSALNWMNRTLTTEGQEAMVDTSGAYPAVPAALPAFKRQAKDPVDKYLAGLTLEEILRLATPAEGFAPVSNGKDVVTLDEANQAWNQFKSKL